MSNPLLAQSASKDIEAQSKPDESQVLQRASADAMEYGTVPTAVTTLRAAPTTSNTTADCTSPTKARVRRLQSIIFKHSVQDSMTYHTEELSSWNSLLHTSFSVWHRRSLWMVSLKLLILAMVVALLLLICCSRPDTLRAFRFTEIGKFLRVFVGLLLGFFMSASVQRWWNCAGAFQSLCSAVRSLHMHLNSLGVNEEHIRLCLRYGVGSAWILHMQLHVEAMASDEQDDAVKAGWNDIKHGLHDEFAMFQDDEIETLQSISDPAGALWMWIGSIVGFLAEDGEIPPLSSPTYARIMGVVSEGFDAIRDVRSSISMQAPYIYVQMLSSLVHINNIVNAISFGLTSGASVGTLIIHWQGRVFNKADASVNETEATVDMQTLLVSFFFSCFGPFVYQALLEVSIAIAQPFSNKDAVIPTQRIIKTLEKDLHDAIKVADRISWPQARFKKPEKAVIRKSSTASL